MIVSRRSTATWEITRKWIVYYFIDGLEGEDKSSATKLCSAPSTLLSRLGAVGGAAAAAVRNADFWFAPARRGGGTMDGCGANDVAIA